MVHLLEHNLYSVTQCSSFLHWIWLLLNFSSGSAGNITWLTGKVFYKLVTWNIGKPSCKKPISALKKNILIILRIHSPLHLHAVNHLEIFCIRFVEIAFSLWIYMISLVFACVWMDSFAEIREGVKNIERGCPSFLRGYRNFREGKKYFQYILRGRDHYQNFSTFRRGQCFVKSGGEGWSLTIVVIFWGCIFRFNNKNQGFVKSIPKKYHVKNTPISVKV